MFARAILPSCLVLAAFAVLLAGCGHGGGPSGPQSIEGTPAQITAAALSYVNDFRGQAGEVPLADSPVLDAAAIRHAGWMVLQGIGYTHFETLDGTAGGAPALNNVLFAGVTLPTRVQFQNNLGDLVPGAIYSESICSVPGPNAINWMWYSIYHRLPLMRASTTLFGFGDWDASLDAFNNDGLPQGSGYATCVVMTDPSVVTVTASSWPPAGAIAIVPDFDPAAETPNAFDPNNGGQTPPTPATGLLGTPLHVILPTSQNWGTIGATLTDANGDNLPLYLLVGGTNVPALTAVNAAATAAFTDSHLQTGELFLVPQAPLQSNSVYVVTLSAVTTGTTPDSINLGFNSPWNFTTSQ